MNVAYYVDTSGMGPFDPSSGADQLLGTINTAGTDGGFDLNNIDVSKYSGYEKFYAVAENDAGWYSAPNTWTRHSTSR